MGAGTGTAVERAAPVKAGTGIAAALDALTQQVNRIEQSIEEHAGTIDPVLRPEAPAAAPADREPDDPALAGGECGVAERIRALHDRVKVAAGRIEYATHRVDL